MSGHSSSFFNSDSNERTGRISMYNCLRNEIEELAARTTDLSLESAIEGSRIWKQVNEIPRNDADTDELALSGSVEQSIATFFIDKLPTLQISDEQATLDSFVNNLKKRVEKSGWENVMKPFDFLRAGVSFQTLNPRTIEPPVNASVKEKKPRQRKIDQVSTQATQPTQISGDLPSEDHNAHVRLVAKTLDRVCRLGNGPVELWPFVIDPFSFENTVENMFSVNILVNNDKAHLISDNSVYYLEPAKSAKNSNTVRPKTQMILSVSVAQYQRFIKLYNIKESMIRRPD